MKSFKQYLNEVSLKSIGKIAAIAGACIGGACSTAPGPQETPAVSVAAPEITVPAVARTTSDESWRNGLSPEQQKEVEKRVNALTAKSDAEAARRAGAMSGVNPRAPARGPDQPFVDPTVPNPRNQGFVHDPVKGTWVPAPGLKFRPGGSSSAGR